MWQEPQLSIAASTEERQCDLKTYERYDSLQKYLDIVAVTDARKIEDPLQSNVNY